MKLGWLFAILVALAAAPGRAGPTHPAPRMDPCQKACFTTRADCVGRCGTAAPCSQSCIEASDACLKACDKKKR